MMTIGLFLAVCFLAYSNGANDNFKGVASLYGSGACSYRRALTWATICTLAGSLCALFLANTLLVKFSGKGVAPDALVQSVPFIAAVASGAGLTVIMAVRLGFPISTTHALLGAIIGGTVAAMPETLNLAAVQKNFVLPLLLSPLISVLLAIAVYSTGKQIRQQLNIDKDFCICTTNPQADIPVAQGASVAAMQATNMDITINNTLACQQSQAAVILGLNVRNAINGLHFLSAGTVCFARGLNDTPKMAGLLWLIPHMAVQWVIVAIAVLMAIGGLLQSHRIAATMGQKITTINPGQGLSANLATGTLVVLASVFGLPVSTTHVSVGALFGIGLRNKTANMRMILSILLAWVLTLPCAALCAGSLYTLVKTQI